MAGEVTAADSGVPGPLAADRLRILTDPKGLPARSPAPLAGLVGQDRAVEAIRFGIDMRRDGFNIFVMGDAGSGRHSGTLELLRTRAADEAAPPEWVYVNNFKVPHKPRAIRLPGGKATAFRDAMREMISDLGVALPALFESDEYKSRRGTIEQEAEDAQETAFSSVVEAAREKSIVLMRTPVGFAFVPQKDGELLKPEEFGKLPEDEKSSIQADIDALQERLKSALSGMPRVEKKRRDNIRALNHEMASAVVRIEVDEVRQTFADIEPLAAFLDDVAEDIVGNFEIFLETAAEAQNAAIPAIAGKIGDDPRLKRYAVNVIIGSNSDADHPGAPVISEPNPTFQNLIGRIEHVSQMGALVTDFTLIKPGALHRANGGYLVLDIRQVLSQPGAWDGLKRALRSSEIRISSLAEQYSLASTVSLEPDPIPLNVKVVLIGERVLYYLLHELDPDFASLFKVEADFDESIGRDAAANEAYTRLIDGFAEREDLKPLTREAAARLIDEAAREADDAEKLSMRIGVIADIMREADHWAGATKAAEIGREHVERAIGERQKRKDRLRERTVEAIARDIILVDTDGQLTGQVNGLSVLQVGDLRFGKPSRITARVRMGSGKVVDIEREVELGGPLHSKGVLILSGFLSARYALSGPMSLWASIVFEQSYGGVDGDSASSAELYALLSALSELPVRQDLAVTGSVNQFGQVQAIGGVNEKIEGFFDVCTAHGLTGSQGVLIPQANCKHLMLRGDVVEACKAGRFAVYPVRTVDEGIALLTGTSAGERGDSGAFAPGSVNALVEARLEAFAQSRRAFGKGGSDNRGDA